MSVPARCSSVAIIGNGIIGHGVTQVFAMAGGSLEHGALQANLAGLLVPQLRGRPCRPLSSDVQVFIKAVGLCTYPDLSVVCGEPQLHAGRALMNPVVVFEVLWPSSEGYDRGEKFAMYRQLESLRQYVLIAQDRRSVEVFTRQDDESWRLESFRSAEAVARIDAIGCTLPMSQLYESVVLPSRPYHPDFDQSR